MTPRFCHVKDIHVFFLSILSLQAPLYHNFYLLYILLHYASTKKKLNSTLLYISLPLLYFTLYISLPWFYLTLLYSTLLYHGSISLYLTLHYTTMALLHSTSLYISLPWLYLTILYYTMALLYRTHSTLLYTMALLVST